MKKDILQINKFSYLHNNTTIFFCKTDYIDSIFATIANQKNNVILITGNSDYGITDDIVNTAPKNIVKWFCQNKFSDNQILESIPIGIDNAIECAISGHGKVWPNAIHRTQQLEQDYDVVPEKLIYANFSLETNADRLKLADICKELPYVTQNIVREHSASDQRPYNTYIQEILEHKMILCPNGHGCSYDTHRLYETLYLNRIPITFCPIQYRYLHYRFNPILITDLDQLTDKSWILDQYQNTINKIDKKVLDFQYWKNIIIEESKKL